jgi:GT2 family glycosyltransferase
MNKTINILTRTSGRPNYFKENCASIKAQTYPHIRHIACADDDESFEYASKLADKVIRVERPEKRKQYGWMHSPYNFYCNQLMDQVEDGWVMFLDDDDVLTDPTYLEEVMKLVTSEDQLIIWKGQIHDKIIPSFSFGKGVALMDIGSFCFLFHSKHKWAAQWDEVKESDFRVALKLARLLPITWFDNVVTKVNNDKSLHGPTGVGLGNRKDK